MITEQAPQVPSPQPFFAAVRCGILAQAGKEGPAPRRGDLRAIQGEADHAGGYPQSAFRAIGAVTNP